MPSLAQGYGRGMLLGLKLQEAEDEREQRRLQGERQRIQDERTGLLNRLTQIQIANWQKDQAEEKQQQTMMGDLTQLQSVYGPGIVPGILEHHGVPTETKGRIAEMFPLKQMFPGMYPEKEKAGKGKEPKLSADWKKAPQKKETAVQKWKGTWEKYILDNLTRRGEYEGLNPAEKRKYFNEWAKRVPDSLKMEVRKAVGLEGRSAAPSAGVNRVMGVPPPEKPEGKPDRKMSGGSYYKEKLEKRYSSTFYGATSYEEVEQSAASLPAEQRELLLAQARAFFGTK